MRITLVNRFDYCGGAEIVVQNQFEEYQRRGHDVRVFVGAKRGKQPEVFQLPSSNSDVIQALEESDIVHCHNLHGKYLNYSVLQHLGLTMPVLVTLHDQFSFTGGCVQTRGCDKWVSGCGQCPQVNASLQRDGTSGEWEAKRAIWESGNFTFVAPAQWIYQRALCSILAQSSNRVVHIANGVDTTRFYPRTHSNRNEVNITMLVSAQAFRTNRSKDYSLLTATLQLISDRLETPATLVVMGDDGPMERRGLLTIMFAGMIRERSKVAALFRSADIFIHPTQVETFCLSILEAMASGCAVISTKAGGVEEQLEASSPKSRGLVVPLADPQALANGVLQLVSDKNLRMSLSERARSFVTSHWTLEHHVNAHLTLYEQILSKHKQDSLGRQDEWKRS